MREFDYQPHTRTDEHYHIRELYEAQDKRVADRNYHRQRIKDLEDREDLIKDAKFFIQTDFYCDRCKQDFKSQAVKQFEIDWSCPSQRIAFYRAKCDKGHWCQRLITDRHKDGFWQKSKLCVLDRGNHFRDIVQNYESGFNLLYGKPKYANI